MFRSQNYSSLENQFLLAMPQLGGSYFEDSVTYLWKHTEEGAIGIVINKPLQYTEMDIFKELKSKCIEEQKSVIQRQVLSGGPVEKDKGFIIHDSKNEWESSISITPEIKSAHLKLF